DVPIEIQNGIGICPLRRDVVLAVSRRHRKPGLSFGETSIRRCAPLHRRTLPVSTLLFRPTQSADRIFYVLTALGVIVAHPDLFAVIHNGCSAQRQIKPRSSFRNRIFVLTVSKRESCCWVVWIVNKENR